MGEGVGDEVVVVDEVEGVELFFVDVGGKLWQYFGIFGHEVTVVGVARVVVGKVGEARADAGFDRFEEESAIREGAGFFVDVDSSSGKL